MIIIIEGVDCTGKSTLANELAARSRADGDDVTQIHMGVPEDDPMIEYEFSLSGYRAGTGKTIICDRWHLGADVYGPLKRLDDGLKDAVRWHIEAFLRARGAFLVLARPTSTEEHLSLMNARGEDYISNDEAILVADAFDVVASRSSLTKVNGSIPFDTDSIYASARAAELRASQIAPFHSYVGPSRPKTLLLGDRKKRDEKTTAVQLSAEGAFAPYGSSSGTYLINALLVTSPSDVSMNSIGMANANEEDVARLWDALYNPTIIALGQEASDACEKAHVPFTRTYHPAYVRRFMHSTQRTYGRKMW